jgi:pimeloyl-ACP methyl ester carboxylesterase
VKRSREAGRAADPESADEAVRVRRVSRGGVRLFVREWTSDGPAVLLLHGLASSSVIWEGVARRLWPRFHVVAYDQRGHGRSAKPDGGYGFDDMCADASRVIASLRLERPLVVGHSWGANVALQLGVERADEVSRLVLVDGGFMQMSDRMDWPTARRQLAPPRINGMELERLLEYARTGPLREVWNVDAERTLRSLFDVHDGRVRPRLSRANHMKILRALWGQPTFELLAGLRVPALIVAARPKEVGDDDAEFVASKQAAEERVRSVNPLVRFEWIQSIHDVPLQRPGELARRISAFSRGR